MRAGTETTSAANGAATEIEDARRAYKKARRRARLALAFERDAERAYAASLRPKSARDWLRAALGRRRRREGWPADVTDKRRAAREAIAALGRAAERLCAANGAAE